MRLFRIIRGHFPVRMIKRMTQCRRCSLLLLSYNTSLTSREDIIKSQKVMITYHIKKERKKKQGRETTSQ
eukprot:scaffold33616_cov57-Cyclotella_meneghiniana.AAC.1